MCYVFVRARSAFRYEKELFFEVFGLFSLFSKEETWLGAQKFWNPKQSQHKNSFLNTKRNPRVMMSCVFAFAYFARSESIQERDSKEKKEGERRSPHTRTKKQRREKRTVCVRVLIVFFVENSQQNTFPQFI